mgnify:CR=1 FL=1
MNKTIKAKVKREFYRVGKKEFETPWAAIAFCYAEMFPEAGKAGWRRGMCVERVAEIDPVGGDDWWEPTTEVVTGKLSVPSPNALAQDPEMSRYHPNNGWGVPETINVEV